MTVESLLSIRRTRLQWCLISLVIVCVLSATGRVIASQSVELTWDQSSSDDIVAYKVYYGTTSLVYPNSITYGDVSDVVVPGLSDGTTYYFAVSAIDAEGDESALSSEVVYVAPSAASLALQAQGSSAALGAVALSWNASSDPDVYAYTVNYGLSSGDYTNSIVFYDSTNGIISGLSPGVTYYFSVSPMDAYGVQASASTEAAYTIPPAQPLTLSAATAVGTSGVELTWNGITNADVATYYAYYGTASGNDTQVINCGNTTQFAVLGLAAGQVYYFRVAAVDGYGNQSAFSNEASSPAGSAPRVSLQVQSSSDAFGAVALSFSSGASDVYGYDVYYWEPGSASTNSVVFYSTSGMITGLPSGTNFDFAAAPIDDYGLEPVTSSEVSCTVPSSQPIVLTACAVTNAPEVALRWSSFTNFGVSAYILFYGTQSGSYFEGINCGPVTNTVMRGLGGAQRYYFAVGAVDGYGNLGPLSNETSVQTVSPTPAVLELTTESDGDGQPYYLEIHTPSTVSGPWELDSSTDLQNWTPYTNGNGSGYGDGYDVDVYVFIDPTQPQVYYRLVQ